MKILGIDPGSRVTGFGIIEVEEKRDPRLFKYGHISTKASQPLARRVFEIYREIHDLLVAEQPDVMVMESVFYANNVKTAITMGHVRGAVMVAAEQKEIPLYEYSPREIKLSVVGNGGAGKSQVAYMVQRILGVKTAIEPADAADALAAALCHWHRMNLKQF